MKPFKTTLLSSAVIPAALLAAGVLTVPAVAGTGAKTAAANPAAAKRLPQVAQNPCAANNPCNPCAAKNPCNPCATKNPCNPCGAKNPCNPCGAKNPCNPCGASNPCNPCNPCGPCGAGAANFSSACVVPRLQAAAAGNPCNPCGAKNPCNPCGAKNPCNPCGAKNPCNPCAAKNPCNPCGAKNPCNPCAAKNPCNPCAAKNPCNPCAAKNPCNPCGAGNPCNPCGPCGAAAAPVELTTAEANAVYDCLKGEMKTAYAKSGDKYAKVFLNWKNYAKQPYVSATHGQRYVLNYANDKASNYGKYENAGKMAPGAVTAKNSFTVNARGQVSVGPLFLMEKHNAGFNRNSHDWQYTLIMPNGQTVGTTNGKGKASVKFCYECHNAVAEDQDAMMFLPEELRVN